MFYAIVAVICLILDQLAKYWTSTHLEVGEFLCTEAGEKQAILGLIRVTHSTNAGAAFNFLSGARWFFVVLCIVFVAVVIYLMAKNVIRHPAARWAAVVVMAGAVGNCLDRAISGEVVDMIQFAFWDKFPVFNLADVFITLGVVVFIIATLLEKDDKQAAPAAVKANRQTAPARAAADPAEEPTRSVRPARRPQTVRESAEQTAEEAEPERKAAIEPDRKPRPAPRRRTKTEIPDFPKREKTEQPKVDPDDPFAEWERRAAEPKKPESDEGGAVVQLRPQTRTEAEPAPAPKTEPVPKAEPAPAPKTEPAPKAAPPAAEPAHKGKTDEDEFDLDSILAEFKDI